MKSDDRYNEYDNGGKMFGFLNVRPIGVTKMNILVMLFLEFIGETVFLWENIYNVYYFQN